MDRSASDTPQRSAHVHSTTNTSPLVRHINHRAPPPRRAWRKDYRSRRGILPPRRLYLRPISAGVSVTARPSQSSPGHPHGGNCRGTDVRPARGGDRARAVYAGLRGFPSVKIDYREEFLRTTDARWFITARPATRAFSSSATSPDARGLRGQRCARSSIPGATSTARSRRGATVGG